jgi:hypothetical protein
MQSGPISSLCSRCAHAVSGLSRLPCVRAEEKQRSLHPPPSVSLSSPSLGLPSLSYLSRSPHPLPYNSPHWRTPPTEFRANGGLPPEIHADGLPPELHAGGFPPTRRAQRRRGAPRAALLPLGWPLPLRPPRFDGEGELRWIELPCSVAAERGRGTPGGAWQRRRRARRMRRRGEVGPPPCAPPLPATHARPSSSKRAEADATEVGLPAVEQSTSSASSSGGGRRDGSGARRRRRGQSSRPHQGHAPPPPAGPHLLPCAACCAAPRQLRRSRPATACFGGSIDDAIVDPHHRRRGDAERHDLVGAKHGRGRAPVEEELEVNAEASPLLFPTHGTPSSSSHIGTCAFLRQLAAPCSGHGRDVEERGGGIHARALAGGGGRLGEEREGPAPSAGREGGAAPDAWCRERGTSGVMVAGDGE